MQSPKAWPCPFPRLLLRASGLSTLDWLGNSCPCGAGSRCLVTAGLGGGEELWGVKLLRPFLSSSARCRGGLDGRTNGLHIPTASPISLLGNGGKHELLCLATAAANEAETLGNKMTKIQRDE